MAKSGLAHVTVPVGNLSTGIPCSQISGKERGRARIGGMFAITTLSPRWQTFFFATAVVLFGLHGIGFDQRSRRLRFDGLGLAVFGFVFFWNALAAT
jgi:hypothetical protein